MGFNSGFKGLMLCVCVCVCVCVCDFFFIFCGTLDLELLTSVSAASAYVDFLQFCHRSKHFVLEIGGAWWHCCLNHCATTRKVAASIPDGVTGIVHLHYPSGRIMALGSIQLLTEMSTGNISCGSKSGRCLGLTPPFMCRLSGNLGAVTSWKHQGL